MGMGQESAWGVARQRPLKYQRKVDAATRCSGACSQTWPDTCRQIHEIHRTWLQTSKASVTLFRRALWVPVMASDAAFLSAYNGAIEGDFMPTHGVLSVRYPLNAERQTRKQHVPFWFLLWPGRGQNLTIDLPDSEQTLKSLCHRIIWFSCNWFTWFCWNNNF